MKRSRMISPYFRLLCVLSIALLATAVRAQTLALSVSPSAITLHPGDQNVPIVVSVGTSTYAGPVSIVLTGLPSGISASPLILTAGTSGTLQLSASRSAGREGFINTAPSAPAQWIAQVTVAGVTNAVQTTTQLQITISLSNPSFAPAPSAINLPIVNIDTAGVGVTNKTTNVPGTITITSADGQISYLPNAGDSDNTATFHVHGNTTAQMPKVAYAVKLNTSLDLLTSMGLVCPYVNSKGKAVCDKSKSYVLLANYDDKTLLRDWSASALANAIPIGNGYLDSPANSPTPSGTGTLMPWAPHSLFVELFLNGVYEGNYQLIEKVNVDGNRININELAQTDTTDDITGGYLLEIDARMGEDFNFTTPAGIKIGLVDPDYTPEVAQQTAYISDYVSTAENALLGANFTDPSLGWRAYFDEASAVNFYIVNDLMGNNDGGAFYSSDYLYKNIDNPLLYMGPVWDFDVSSGNVNYSLIENPTIPWMQTHARWYGQLFKDPAFKADVVSQWNSLKSNGVLDAWLASIQQQAQNLEQSQANNFGRWPMQGIEVWPNPEAAGSYDGEVAYYMNWLRTRIAYLDSVFNGKLQTTTALAVPTGTLREGTLVSLQATVAGGSNPTGSVTFLSGSIVLGVGTLDGGQHAVLAASLQAGTDSLTAVYNGDATNALSASTAASASVLPPLVSTVAVLSSSVSNATPAHPATFTAVVLGNSGTTKPTGTVAFAANGQSLGSAALAGDGTAVFSPTQLPNGTDSIQATYAGDATYQGSASNTLILTADFKKSQTITFTALPAVSYGVAPMTLAATTSSGLPVGYTVTGPATVSGSTLSVTGIGAVAVTANQAGDADYDAAAPVARSFSVNRALLTVAANNATRAYEAANPAFSYTVTGFVNGENVSVVSGTATLGSSATINSPVGSYPIVFSAESLAAADYAFTYVNGTLTIVSQAVAATPTFTPAGGNYASAQTVVIADGTPGASIYYTADGSTPTASSSKYTAAIPVGATTVLKAIAVAPGYADSSIAAATYTVNLPPPDFAVDVPAASLTLTAGQSGTVAISITAQHGFDAPVSFACSGLPQGATCSFSPATLTPTGGTAVTTTLTIATSAALQAHNGKSKAPMPETVLAVALCCFGWRKRGRMHRTLMWMSAMLGLGLLSGCGGGSPAVQSSPTRQPTTSTVTITATAGALVHTSTLTLNIN